MANEKQLITVVKDSANQIWLAGLGAFVKAQDEGGRMFDTLVKEGEKVEARTRKAAIKKAEAARDKARKTASGSINKLEKVFQDRVARALTRLGVPSREDIQGLSKRVDELTKAVSRLAEEREGR
jgi:poly(hydroxyalkanoate) granule-associated protein